MIATSEPVTAPTNARAASPDLPAFTKGTWTVSQLTQCAEDKASKLAGYVFSFTKTGDESGTVTVTRGGTSVTGSWANRPAVTYYGATSTEAMVLHFGTSADLSRLSKTWNVASITQTRITWTIRNCSRRNTSPSRSSSNSHRGVPPRRRPSLGGAPPRPKPRRRGCRRALAVGRTNRHCDDRRRARCGRVRRAPQREELTGNRWKPD